MDEKFQQASALLYLGADPGRLDIFPEAPAIYQTSSYTMEDLNELYAKYDDGGYTYSRLSNPNRSELAAAITYLEKGEKSLVFSSGMGAISVAILTAVKAGGHVLANSKLYGETTTLLSEILNEYGIEATFVDFNDETALREAIRPNTRLFYTEILSNPLTSVVDIDMVVGIARGASALVAVDNTFTSPFLISPLEHGADIVVNSVTKLLNGHFDVTAGVMTVRDMALFARAEKLITLFGSTLDPNSAWLALRGLRTAPLRIAKQNENAKALAAALERHPKVAEVFHPSLQFHPQHALAQKLLTKDHYGALLSFAIEDSARSMALMDRFLHHLEMVKYANTLGGYRTTLSHPCSASHHDIPDEMRRKVCIHPGVMRVSCGLEDTGDLIGVFCRALDRL